MTLAANVGLGLLYVLAWLVCALVAAAAGAGRGRAGAGFLLGVVFGPAGVMLALFLPAAAPKYRPRQRRRVVHAGGKHKAP